jgi:hypothetical protein
MDLAAHHFFHCALSVKSAARFPAGTGLTGSGRTFLSRVIEVFAPGWDFSGVHHTDGHLCFERARLQSCRKRHKMSWALAPEGMLFYEFIPFEGLGK